MKKINPNHHLFHRLDEYDHPVRLPGSYQSSRWEQWTFAVSVALYSSWTRIKDVARKEKQDWQWKLIWIVIVAAVTAEFCGWGR